MVKMISLAVLLVILAGMVLLHEQSQATDAYRKITPKEAKLIMDSKKPHILLDVRTLAEFKEEHIAGAILLPDDEIQKNAEKILLDKKATILVYCRSGRRSQNAARKLAEIGYANVYDFGGILDWPYEKTVEGKE